MIKSEILVTTGMVWQVSSDRIESALREKGKKKRKKEAGKVNFFKRNTTTKTTNKRICEAYLPDISVCNTYVYGG